MGKIKEVEVDMFIVVTHVAVTTMHKNSSAVSMKYLPSFDMYISI